MSVTLTYISSTQSSVTVEARHTFANGSRAYWDYRQSGSTSWLNRGYTLLSSNTYQQFEFTSLTAGTNYEFRVRIVDGSQSSLPVLGSATTTGATESPTLPAPSGLSVSSTSNTEVYLSWNNVSGASYYELYCPELGNSRTTNNTYAWWGGLSPGTYYRFRVRAYNSSNYPGNWSSYVSITMPSDPPSIWNLQGTPSSTSIYITWDAYSNVGIKEFRVYRSATLYNTVSASSREYNVTGLSENTTYTIRVVVYDLNNQTAETSKSFTTLSGRPNNWSWTIAKVEGNDFRVTETEWNNFATRINQFRQWRGLSNYSFSAAYNGNDFLANMFNQARTAINAMSPPTSVPASVVSGDDVTATGLNRLRDSLNSL